MTFRARGWSHASRVALGVGFLSVLYDRRDLDPYARCGRNYPLQWFLEGVTQREADAWSSPAGILGCGYNFEVGCSAPPRVWVPTRFGNGTYYSEWVLEYTARGQQATVWADGPSPAILYTVQYQTVFTASRLLSLEWPWVSRPSGVERWGASSPPEIARYSFDRFGRVVERADFFRNETRKGGTHWRYATWLDNEASLRWTDEDTAGVAIVREIDKKRALLRTTYQRWIPAPDFACDSGYACRHPGATARPSEECIVCPCDVADTIVETIFGIHFANNTAAGTNLTRIYKGTARGQQIQYCNFTGQGRFANQTFEDDLMNLAAYGPDGRLVGAFHCLYLFEACILIGGLFEKPDSTASVASVMLGNGARPARQVAKQGSLFSTIASAQERTMGSFPGTVVDLRRLRI